MGDPFLDNYRPEELRIASEFLTTWLPFLQRDLCSDCADTLANRVRSLDPGTTKVGGSSKPRQLEGNRRLGHPSVEEELNVEENGYNNYDANSLGSADHDEADTNSLGSWKDGAQGFAELSPEASSSNSVNEFPAVEVRSQHMSWADMAQEDELEEEDELEDKRVVNMNASTGELRVSTVPDKPKLSRDQREQFRFMNVKRNKDFICLERINGKLVNILQGLELHAGVFSAAEQKRIVDFVYELQESGRKGILKERTYTAPAKWMRGKGRVTLQFGCCYNYAPDKNGNPPGILLNETVDPIPHLFKVIIRRLVRWHVLPPTCVPDSCIVNIYDESDCIPPHIDNHDFVRPFCTVSFLSECKIVFGSNLKIVGPGEFKGPFELPLPMGSVLVLNGNGADVAKHCVPAVPTKRISITFRRMDESKRPKGYFPERDLLGIQPLSYEEEERSRQPSSLNQGRHHGRRQQQGRRDPNSGGRGYSDRRDSHPDSSNSYSSHNRRGPSNRQRFRPNPSG